MIVNGVAHTPQNGLSAASGRWRDLNSDGEGVSCAGFFIRRVRDVPEGNSLISNTFFLGAGETITATPPPPPEVTVAEEGLAGVLCVEDGFEEDDDLDGLVEDDLEGFSIDARSVPEVVDTAVVVSCLLFESESCTCSTSSRTLPPRPSKTLRLRC